LLHTDLMCLQTTKQHRANKFQRINSKPTNTTSTGFDENNTIRTQFSRYNNIGDMQTPPAWSIGRIQSSKTTTLLNNHKSTHLSVFIPPQNGKITIKTEILHKYNNFLLITITITSKSFTNNSIEGNIPLFSAKQKHPTIMISQSLSIHFPTKPWPTTHLVNDATYTLSPAKQKPEQRV